MRKQHGIPTGCPIRTGSLEPRADGRLSARAAATRLGVTPSLVHLGAAWNHQVRSALSLFQAVGPIDERGHHEARWLSRRQWIADCH